MNFEERKMAAISAFLSLSDDMNESEVEALNMVINHNTENRWLQFRKN